MATNNKLKTYNENDIKNNNIINISKNTTNNNSLTENRINTNNNAKQKSEITRFNTIGRNHDLSIINNFLMKKKNFHLL